MERSDCTSDAVEATRPAPAPAAAAAAAAPAIEAPAAVDATSAEAQDRFGTVAELFEELNASRPGLEQEVREVREAEKWALGQKEEAYDNLFAQMDATFDDDLWNYWQSGLDGPSPNGPSRHLEETHRALPYLAKTSEKFFLAVRETCKLNGRETGRTIRYPDEFIVTERKMVNRREWGAVKEGGWVRLTLDGHPLTMVVKSEWHDGERPPKRQRGL